MNRPAFPGLPAVVLFAISGVAAAHHSQSMFVTTPVWVSGTIVRYRPVDPHAMIELREQQPDGTVRKWIVEGPRRARLERILRDNGGTTDDRFLKVGDRISVCGFPLKKDFDPKGMYADWPPEQERFVHGQVLVMPDGRMQSWGPYGAIDNCVRPGEPARDWASFLDRDPLAHKLWCDAKALTAGARLTPRTFIDEVDRGLKSPCK